jgi:hypothetical protein
MNYKFPVNPILGSKLRNNEGLIVCPDCKGTGSNPNYDKVNSEIYKVQLLDLNRNESEIFIMNCLKCNGDGYLYWTENATDKTNRDCRRLLMKNIRETCIYFLYSCLFAERSYSPNFIYYSSFSDDYYINFEINFCSSTRIFYANAKLVDKYLLPKDIRMFMRGIHRWDIKHGHTCTNCFKEISPKYFKDKNKRVVQRIAMTPETEIDYLELFAEEAYYPIFILCDACYFKLNSGQIQSLKEDAFDPFDPYEFSVIQYYRMLEYIYGFYHDKYFDNFSEYFKMKI